MKRQKLEIGHGLLVDVHWYDLVPEPEKEILYQGEVIGWRDRQIIVRIRDYAVLRFWKKNGLEVGNRDHDRRGFKLNLKEIEESLRPAPGVSVELAIGQ